MTDDLEQRVAALEKVAHEPVDQTAVAIAIFNQLTSEMRTAYDLRITELLAANNREVERRRAAELERNQLRARLVKLGA